MTDQMFIASVLGAVFSFILQILKRWITFSGNQVRGFIYFCAIAYAVAIFAIDGVSVKDVILNIGAFIFANQGLFALIFNNTEFGKAVADQ